MTPKIIYTKTDEAPALATYSLLPIIEAFAGQCGIKVETRDISLAGRIISTFPEHLSEDQHQSDDLAYLGELAKLPEANIIKLPNISASVPQLKAAIKELQIKGYALPDYPEEATSEAATVIKAKYDKIKGSAVNPVLREGNSDRRAPKAVKAYAQKNPHSMGAWSSASKTHVASMTEGDFYSSERSVTVSEATDVRIEHVAADGTVSVLKASTALLANEIIDAAVLSQSALTSYFAREIDAAKAEGSLLSVHLKATMMKVSDPIIFGQAVTVFYADLFEKHGALLEQIGFDVNNGMGDLEGKLAELSADQRAAIEATIADIYANRPELSMVDSDRGITNLHVPSDVIIDASMPAMIRNGGQLWGPDGSTNDTKALIPDRSYAGVYQVVIEDCKQNGAYDVSTMGSVPNVGLMAKKAEEYGSHDKTFQMSAAGTVRVVDSGGTTLLSHEVAEGDIWRMCQVKDAPIRDWVGLAVRRMRATGVPGVFWLDANRAHDAQIIAKVNAYLPEHDIEGLEYHILAPVEATRFSLERIRQGNDTISFTGNVLRDYLTDLFPILELGTSAKMLSIVPLMNGGGLFETGAGGSAPKHVQQFEKENHLRWDSLGEYLALGASLEHLNISFNNSKAQVLADALDAATTQYLDNRRSPSRRVKELDNRGSSFFLALYWAKALAEQTTDMELKATFGPVATELVEKQEQIVAELNEVQGASMNVGGYYHPEDAQAAEAMRPSPTLNSIIQAI